MLTAHPNGSSHVRMWCCSAGAQQLLLASPLFRERTDHIGFVGAVPPSQFGPESSTGRSRISRGLEPGLTGDARLHHGVAARSQIRKRPVKLKMDSLLAKLIAGFKSVLLGFLEHRIVSRIY